MDERTRNNTLVRTYGITADEYDEVLETQNGGCAICHKPPGKHRLSVDHDHKTGQVRGLLCSLCNRALAKFGDNHDLLISAARYLEYAEWLWAFTTDETKAERLIYRGRVDGKARRKRIAEWRKRGPTD